MLGITDALEAIMQLPGAQGVVLVDVPAELPVARDGRESLRWDDALPALVAFLEIARDNILRASTSASTTDERAAFETDEAAMDIVVTLGAQYHLAYPLPDECGQTGLYLYVVLTRTTANAMLACRKVSQIAAEVRISPIEAARMAARRRAAPMKAQATTDTIAVETPADPTLKPSPAAASSVARIPAPPVAAPVSVIPAAASEKSESATRRGTAREIVVQSIGNTPKTKSLEEFEVPPFMREDAVLRMLGLAMPSLGDAQA